MNSLQEKISIVIPTYNMAEHIQRLWGTLLRSGFSHDWIEEVIFVDDGSVDATADTVLKFTGPENAPPARLISLGKNEGRFVARYKGALEARTERILFLDSRVELTDTFGFDLKKLTPEYPCLMGWVDLDTSRNIYCLYWDRIHRALFKKHFELSETRAFVIDDTNFDGFLKGTTVFLCSRKLFIDACRLYENTPLLSDDTYLMREMVKTEPIVVHPSLRILWRPREAFKPFLQRLYSRGPQFIEYNFFCQRGLLFWVVLAGCTGVVSWLILLIFSLKWAAITLGIVLFFAGLSTCKLSRTLGEFFKLLPLHILVLFTFGFGLLNGIRINTLRALRGEFPWPAHQQRL